MMLYYNFSGEILGLGTAPIVSALLVIRTISRQKEVM